MYQQGDADDSSVDNGNYGAPETVGERVTVTISGEDAKETQIDQSNGRLGEPHQKGPPGGMTPPECGFCGKTNDEEDIGENIE